MEIEFALANGAQYFLERSVNGAALGEIALEAEGWSVHILPLSADHRSLAAGIDSDGTKLTHSGKIRRVNGGSFGSDEAQVLLSNLGLFLSFAAGWWVGIGFIRGRNKTGKVLWQEWGLSRVQHQTTGHSWHHWNMEGMLAQLFPGFLHLLRRSSWKEPLETVLYWYNRSNSMAAGVDGSIILTQAAFELLAWQVLVQESNLLSEDNFQSLNAEGQIRVLLGHLGIPLAIPAVLVELNKTAKEFNWSCGPQALVAIRNKLVHPAKKRRKGSDGPDRFPYFESCLLGLQLIELCILRLCGYSGTYIDRAQRGFPKAKPVPWTPSASR